VTRPILGFARLSPLSRRETRRGSGGRGAFLGLFLIISGHTILETARDALLLAKLPPAWLAGVYSPSPRLPSPRSPARRAWWPGSAPPRARRTLAGAAALAAVLFALPSSTASVLALYVGSGLIGGGPGSAVLGARRQALHGVAGAAAPRPHRLGLAFSVGSPARRLPRAALSAVAVQDLVALAGLLFIAAAWWPPPSAARNGASRAALRRRAQPRQALRDEPFPRRIALIVCLSTRRSSSWTTSSSGRWRASIPTSASAPSSRATTPS